MIAAAGFAYDALQIASGRQTTFGNGMLLAATGTGILTLDDLFGAPGQRPHVVSDLLMAVGLSI